MRGAGPCCSEALDLLPGDLGTWGHRSCPSTLEFAEPEREQVAELPASPVPCSRLLHSLGGRPRPPRQAWPPQPQPSPQTPLPPRTPVHQCGYICFVSEILPIFLCVFALLTRQRDVFTPDRSEERGRGAAQTALRAASPHTCQKGRQLVTV